MTLKIKIIKYLIIINMAVVSGNSNTVHFEENKNPLNDRRTPPTPTMPIRRSPLVIFSPIIDPIPIPMDITASKKVETDSSPKRISRQKLGSDAIKKKPKNQNQLIPYILYFVSGEKWASFLNHVEEAARQWLICLSQVGLARQLLLHYIQGRCHGGPTLRVE